MEGAEGSEGFWIGILALLRSLFYSLLRSRACQACLWLYGKTSRDEFLDVGPQSLRQCFRQRDCFAAEDFNFVRQPRAAANYVVRQGGEGAG